MEFNFRGNRISDRVVGWTVYDDAALWMEYCNSLSYWNSDLREYVFLACQSKEHCWRKPVEPYLGVYNSTSNIHIDP